MLIVALTLCDRESDDDRHSTEDDLESVDARFDRIASFLAGES